MGGIVDVSLIGTVLKTGIMLAVVLACMIGILYAMRRFLPLGKRHQGELDIKRLGAFYLSPKERIEVMEISGERIVLGVAPGRINYITTLKADNEISET
ncbi:MAG: flagellar biosynthetic protein FliO [Desulfotignum sp.]|nr:flagellar biosynthetic protein FliO [Desulfotignum sp.]MCF8088872.1 flagellar biosynthetic protein FliO [Desulfotignum sp.]MCF8136093.1 flagellar biosynthetic protein FliO [Desulfotignum sp.]